MHVSSMWLPHTQVRVPELQGKKFIKVACGESHSIALTSGGELYSWGGTLHGKLGRVTPFAAAEKEKEKEREREKEKEKSSSKFGSAADKKKAAAAVEAAAASASALAQQQQSSQDPMSFKVPGALEMKKVVEISCGRLHTVVCTADGQVRVGECLCLGVGRACACIASAFERRWNVYQFIRVTTHFFAL
jgi:alpha-tubulin suppressor-like RCC1 family protein